MAHAESAYPRRAARAATRGAPGRGSEVWQRGLVYLLLTIGLAVMVAPFVWMVFGSIKTSQELLQVPATWFPENPTLDNYRRLFDELDFPRYFLNSTIIAGVTTVSNVLCCSMVGYALAKLSFAGRNKLFALILGTMMVPSGVTLIPLFVLLSKLGLVNTLAGVILPGTVTAFGVFLMRQFMLGIPDDLLDAARMDGAGEFRIFRQIVLPLTTPVLATLGILTFLGSWNNFLLPLIVLTDDAKYNLPVALATFAIGQHASDNGMLMAGSVVIILPVLVVFILLQRYFTQGIAMTGMKG